VMEPRNCYNSGMRAFVRIGLLVLLACLSASGSDYFPLAIGNQWVYRITGASPSAVVVEVLSARVEGDNTYFLVHGFLAEDVWLRADGDGNVFRFAPAERAETLLYAFGLAEGEEYRTSIHGCNPSARIDSKAAHYEGPIGVYGNAIHLAYTNACNYSGLFDETFLPGIGMVQRGDTAVGQFQYNLVYARVGATVIAGPEVAFGLVLDRAAYVSNLREPAERVPLMVARLTIRITQNEPLRLVFPSGQIYEFVIRQENGDIVYRWSNGKAFTAVVQEILFGPGEKNWAITVELGDANGNPFPPGRYLAEAWLMTQGPTAYSTKIAFEVR
jgi:hypothetical protein